eukprot:CAMPEP_0113937380 /NCGR_PEP_ID=MMETSP1339-20121228/4004_1 /TAXON_ID=94617 /ORGANISM="Fibrocapsa japonica" /LENGTH=227 /DNA_ID=CAMNT_0000940111 /DNA_START=313 /DNA_END=996 /DNA_ORIENTATION=+ /assembly_acc=CAM_ASM_000762
MNKRGCLQGRGVNADLNVHGQFQAMTAGKFLSSLGSTDQDVFLCSSTLSRAKQTAQAISTFLPTSRDEVAIMRKSVKNALSAYGGSEVQSAPVSSYPSSPTSSDEQIPSYEDFEELSWGIMEGKSWKEEPYRTMLQEVKKQWDSGNLDASILGGESQLQVRKRSLQALDTVLSKGHKHNIIVSHGRTIRVMLNSLIGKTLEKVPNTAIYIIQYNPQEKKFCLVKPGC